MTSLDNYLQSQRINQVKNFISVNDRVLDIGCGPDPVLFKRLSIQMGIGVDPTIKNIFKGNNFVVYPGYFPEALPEENRIGFFDRITALAVLEHIPTDKLDFFCKSCLSALRKNGKILITVPDKKVDYILSVLTFFKLIDGMSLEEHHGFEVKQTASLFTKYGAKLEMHKKFQLGLNNLYIFSKP